MKTTKVNTKYNIVSNSGREWEIRTFKLNGLYHLNIYYRQNEPDFTFYCSKGYFATKEELFKMVNLAESYLKEKDLF